MIEITEQQLAEWIERLNSIEGTTAGDIVREMEELIRQIVRANKYGNLRG